MPADTRITVGQYLPEHLEAKVGRGDLADSTARSYRDLSRYLLDKLGHVRLAELRGLHLTRAYREIVAERQALIAAAQARNAALAEVAEREAAKRVAAGKTRPVKATRVPVPRPISAATVARIHAVISGALKSATKGGLVPRNVAGDAELPRVERKKVRPPSPEAYGSLLDAIVGERMYVLVLVAGHSGMRRGELAGMRWSDIDLATGRWVLGHQRTSVGYKVVEKSAKTPAGDQRVVFLDAGTLSELRTWKAQQNRERLAWGSAYHDGGYVFTKESGEPYHPDAITKQVARLMRRAGMTTPKLHALRHFRAGALISTGADIAAVSRAMGHSSIGTTSDIYGSLFESANREMSEKAAALIPRRHTA